MLYASAGPPASDAWLGNIQIDPAKGKGHAPDPANTRGRADLFEIMQQKILWENRERQSRSGGSERGSSSGGTLSSNGGTLSSSVAAGGSKPAADQDAWLGNRWVMIMEDVSGRTHAYA
jgi:hypothetical protein